MPNIVVWGWIEEELDMVLPSKDVLIWRGDSENGAPKPDVESGQDRGCGGNAEKESQQPCDSEDKTVIVGDVL